MTSRDLSAEPFRLDDKLAVVTGGGSGIGRAIALKFAANGAAVCILDIRQEDAEATSRQVVESGGSATAFACDVTDQSKVKSSFDKICATNRVHILVNNAGISQIGTVESTSEEDFDSILRVNGYYNCIRACIGHMKDHG